VLSFGRPSLLIQNNEIAEADSDVWRTRLMNVGPTLAPVIPAVGRVELLRSTDFDWVGTGWMIDDDILVTNRHVANLFTKSTNNGFAFSSNFLGQELGAQVDFREEHNVTAEFEIRVTDILYVAAPGRENADIALLRVDRSSGNLPEPLTLAANDPAAGTRVGAIGYPARDSRNDGHVMAQIFGNIYDVKRFAPGFVVDPATGVAFTHDCTTLGGNSGSPIVNLDNGEAVGLHFAGRFRQANFAVRASEVRRQLSSFGSTSVAGVDLDGDQAEARTAADYEGRTGYDENFLGDESVLVPMPDMTAGVGC
jgi:endonuclease G, mitochondrial